ncbi:hypothetical protein BWI17_00570 [Betaproteobacteria bacterium GR16-43]|nr:hypothetical protein BWI17_00570 [Betaproteobacteria bacterium GR16-43]
MGRTVRVLAVLVALAAVFSLGQSMKSRSGDRPPGPVHNAKAAIEIAVAAWTPVYGREQIEKQKPFRALLRGGVWTVEGTLPSNSAGGVVLAEIASDNGRVIRMSDGRR